MKQAVAKSKSGSSEEFKPSARCNARNVSKCLLSLDPSPPEEERGGKHPNFSPSPATEERVASLRAPSACRLKKYKLILAYDGTDYEGWQVQKIGTGVQEKVELALARLFPSKPRLHSSSRTDTGVHALGMVAHFEVPSHEAKIPGRKLVLALNAWLPEDIRVLSAHRASTAFHARFDAAGKQYRYFVWNHPGMNPLLRRTAWHVPRPLDLRAMREAAKLLLGRHDFQSFAANPGYSRESTVRSLSGCLIRKQGHLLTFLIEGDGFLYRMCRGIVGTLVQVGLGKFSPEAISSMLKKRERSAAGMSAPAHGLVLWKVIYGKRRKRVASP